MATVLIEVFTSPTCPHCPAAVKATKELFQKYLELKNDVTWKEMSTGTQLGYRKAVSYGISAVPTIIITNLKTNEKFGIVGVPSEKKYLEIIYKCLGKTEKENDIKKDIKSVKDTNNGGLIDKFAKLFE